MDKDKVLPLTQSCECSTNPRVHPEPPPKHCLRCECFVGIAQEQRDADWERVKPLVEALQKIALESGEAEVSDGAWEAALIAREALAQLDVEVSDG